MALEQNIYKYGRNLTRRQFDAFCYCRLPGARFMGVEVEWFSLFENHLLALIFQDVIDNDYSFIILGRDLRKLFRLVDIGDFYESIAEAKEALTVALYEKHVGKLKAVYEQGDEKEKNLDLFTQILPEKIQHRAYKILCNEPRYEAARNLISEIANSFIDNDGHYEREFQSINFNARLWELYLHVYFHNEGLAIANDFPSPDFELNYFDEKYFVEAVTVNPSLNQNRPDLKPPQEDSDLTEWLNDFMPIKFGSSLYTKLKKKYWELKHVYGHPLIFAIHDYHNDTSMTWSRTALSEYLYGVRSRILNGIVSTEIIQNHNWGDKTVKSGFFQQPDTENISAVLFSNQSTIAKFNRMGKLGGLGSKDYKMFRMGYLYNPAPDSLTPISFIKDIDDEDYEESWSDGLVMFHNPNAIHPINMNAFKDISHIFYSEENGFTGYHQPYDVLSSITIFIDTENNEEQRSGNII